ncbi:unnamed protein product [Allacma fusca]|uniref:Uncharacterized protein n=1 Tax=Allacma fusca TaxID=39272 RepID=A0A8J2J818_9HEXA|nr:unnamed protein product [Allacma fusca]
MFRDFCTSERALIGGVSNKFEMLDRPRARPFHSYSGDAEDYSFTRIFYINLTHIQAGFSYNSQNLEMSIINNVSASHFNGGTGNRDTNFMSCHKINSSSDQEIHRKINQSFAAKATIESKKADSFEVNITKIFLITANSDLRKFLSQKCLGIRWRGYSMGKI